eukprot:TRINITY_DN11462_c0_g1_i1.p1 TRINITY_DN11462_c0_g1~~TRINITY_DN11462_c0_g1_i1.p1  ORF type:complete len:400 (-),score=74.18 TRINITY_DN11462_c0_g1_i1:64-1263(-)
MLLIRSTVSTSSFSDVFFGIFSGQPTISRATFYRKHLWPSAVPYLRYYSDVTDPVLDTSKLSVYIPQLTFAMATNMLNDAPEHVRWFVFCDDDTFLFLHNLADVLQRYDSSEAVYLGNWSESLSQLQQHGRLAFGGGAVVLSRPAMKMLVAAMSECRQRYWHAYSGDLQTFWCLADMGVTLTRERGFHQVDMLGSIRGWLEAEAGVVSPVSLHHLYAVDPIYSVGITMDATMLRLYQTTANSHQQRLFLRRFTLSSVQHSAVIALSYGYSIRVLPLRPLSHLLRSELTFKPWIQATDGWDFDTRAPEDECTYLRFVRTDSATDSESCGAQHYVVEVPKHCTEDKTEEEIAPLAVEFASAAKRARVECAQCDVRADADGICGVEFNGDTLVVQFHCSWCK